MIEKKSWDEFRRTGLTLIINQILHLFGWAIVYRVESGKIIECYPARCKFRGFDENSVTEAYINASRWIKDHANELLREAEGGKNETNNS